jgi:hypothetical protein
MRFTPLVLLFSLLAAGCARDTDDEAYGTVSGVVFGIEQRTDPSTGQTITMAGYEYRFVGWKNHSNGSWVTNAYAYGPDRCMELPSHVESESQHVGDGGRARFVGAALPGEGLVVDANVPSTAWSGAAFGANAPLVFALESGFGVPHFDPVDVPVADVTMRVLEPADGELSIDASKDLRFAWSSDQEADGRVFAVFEPDGRDVKLVCQLDGGVVEASFLRALEKGKLTVKSQRKTVVNPGDKWIVDIVTTNIVREQRFVVR